MDASSSKTEEKRDINQSLNLLPSSHQLQPPVPVQQGILPKKSMARERIIELRHLSVETNSSIFQSGKKGVRNSYRSCRSESEDKEENEQDDDETTIVENNSNLASTSSSLTSWPSPSMRVRDQPNMQSELVTKNYNIPSISVDHPENHNDDDRDENENEDEDQTQQVALIKSNNLPHQSLSKNPYISSSLLDLQAVVNSSSLDLLNQTLDMGKFLDQVTKISNEIDSIEIDLNEHQQFLLKEHQTLRYNLYKKIEDEIIPNLIKLGNSTTISIGTKTNKNEQNSTIIISNDGPTREEEEEKDNNLDICSPFQFSQRIANPLKREQISLLVSKLDHILHRLLNQLNSEKRMVGNEIKYEWNRGLSPCSNRDSQQRMTLRSIADTSDSETTKEDQDQEQEDHNALNLTLFKLLGIDDSDHLSPPTTPSLPTQLISSEEIQKKLNLAVRSSTSYPQARKSSLIILSDFDQLQQIQIELEQVLLLINLLSQHPLYNPASQVTNHHHDVAGDDDSSSISFSIVDGFDNDLTPAYKKINNNNNKNKNNPEKKNEKIKKKEDKKINFKLKINNPFNFKKRQQEEADPDEQQQQQKEAEEEEEGEEEEEEKLTIYKRKPDLESNNNHHYYSTTTCTNNSKSQSSLVDRLHRYRFAIILSTAVFLLLASIAIGVFIILRNHND